jgi:high-affinity iron transporter
VTRLLVALLIALPSCAAHAQLERAQTILHMLDYVAVDYPEAVDAGGVRNADEYKEMLEFTAQVTEGVKALPANAAHLDLAQRAASLERLVQAKAGAAAVATAASQLKWAIVEAYQLSIAPARPPSLDGAPALYAQHCAACHGAEGRGDGPAGKGLEPPPSDFHAAERMAQRSAYGLYNTISLGVGGTSMAAFKQLDEDARWALAFHVASLAADDATRTEGGKLWQQGKARGAFSDLRNVATLSANEVRERFGAEAVLVQVYLRANPAALAATRPAPLDFAAAKIAESLTAYQRGDRDAAGQLAVTAYLEGFELVEPALQSVDAGLMRETEAQMMALRSLMRGGAPNEEVIRQGERVADLLAAAKGKLAPGELSPATTFVSALVILLREGLEAILVVAAIVTFLVKAGRRDALPRVHAGWGAAVVLGIATWFVATYLVDVSGANREITEGVTALVAAAMLVYVGFWLHTKASAHAWQRFIRESVGAALAKRTLWAMSLVAFLAVYREMFETVLFYQALWVQAGAAGRSAFFGGIAAAVVALAAIAWAIFRFGVRLSLGPFFTTMSVLLCALAVVLAGKGVAALQEAGLVSADLVSAPTVPALGVFPTLQSLGAQLAVVAIIVAGFCLAARRVSNARPAAGGS